MTTLVERVRVVAVEGDDLESVLSLLRVLPRELGVALLVATDRDDATARIESIRGVRPVTVGPSTVFESDQIYVVRDAERRKDEILATLSHELRNPLTPLKVALDVARLAKDDPEKVAQSHAIMERQVRAITDLVDGLLDLTGVTQGKIELARVPVEPALLVEAVLEATRPLVSEQRHQVSVSLPAETRRVLGDVRRLTQVLTNVVNNAAKYTPPDGHIQIDVRDDNARNMLVFSITDNGIGIDPGLLPRIFDIFVQARDEEQRARGGLGIGLNVVRRLVELHGGRVEARSAGVNRGSTFVIELPSISQ